MVIKFIIPSVPSEVAFTAPLMVRGFDDVDDIELVNPISQVGLEGTLIQTCIGFRRVITVDLGVVFDKTSRVFLVTWMLAADRQLEYAGEVLSVTPRDASGFSSVIKESKYFRRYRFEVTDKVPLTSTPSAWQTTGAWYDADSLPIYGSDGIPIYVRTT